MLLVDTLNRSIEAKNVNATRIVLYSNFSGLDGWLDELFYFNFKIGVLSQLEGQINHTLFVDTITFDISKIIQSVEYVPYIVDELRIN